MLRGVRLRYKEVDSDGDVCLEFTMAGARRPTYRWFKDPASAMAFAGFAAAQAGLRSEEQMREWFRHRDFPEAMVEAFFA